VRERWRSLCNMKRERRMITKRERFCRNHNNKQITLICNIDLSMFTVACPFYLFCWVIMIRLGKAELILACMCIFHMEKLHDMNRVCVFVYVPLWIWKNTYSNKNDIYLAKSEKITNQMYHWYAIALSTFFLAHCVFSSKFLNLVSLTEF